MIAIDWGLHECFDDSRIYSSLFFLIRVTGPNWSLWDDLFSVC